MAADNPIVDSGTQVGTPVATMGFGAREQADETRQSGQGVLNDAQLDVNMNSIVARVQAGTFALMGGNFEAAAMRFNAIMGKTMAEKV
jgi:hypothetical protein